MSLEEEQIEIKKATKPNNEKRNYQTLAVVQGKWRWAGHIAKVDSEVNNRSIRERKTETLRQWL